MVTFPPSPPHLWLVPPEAQPSSPIPTLPEKPRLQFVLVWVLVQLPRDSALGSADVMETPSPAQVQEARGESILTARQTGISCQCPAVREVCPRGDSERSPTRVSLLPSTQDLVEGSGSVEVPILPSPGWQPLAPGSWEDEHVWLA